jgi:alpha-amylase
VFGGCYLPHLRRAVKASLVACDRLLGLAGDGPSVEWREADTNGDGYVEVAARTRTLAVTVNPERGGTLTELAYLARDVDVADVLTRRRESYHARVRDPEPGHGADSAKTIHGAATAREAGLASLLEYDRFRRALLLDGLFAEGGEVDPLEPWKAARAVVGERPMTRAVRARDDEIQVECALDRLDEVPLAVRKTVVVPATRASIEARYALRWDGTSPLAARWGVQLNVALSAGDALGRYFRVPGNPSLGQRDRLANRQDLALVDEWLGCALELGWTRAADAAWAPVQTISLSEAGFERIYQGTAVLVTWPLQLPPGAAWETRITLTFADLAGAPR